MATRLYLRDASPSSNPSAGEKSTALPVGTIQDLGTSEKSLSTTIGSSQTSIAWSSLATTADRDTYIARFSSPVLNVTSLSAQTWTFACAADEGNTNANSFFVLSVYVWDVSANGVLGFVYDSHTSLGTEWSTTQSGRVVTLTGSAVNSISSGQDFLVLEVWRHAIQAMSTSYSQNIYYDGTTDVIANATTDAASYLETPQDGIFTIPFSPPNSGQTYPRSMYTDGGTFTGTTGQLWPRGTGF